MDDEESTPVDEAPAEPIPEPEQPAVPEPEPAAIEEPVAPVARKTDPPTYASSGAASAPAVGAHCTIATCWLQPNPRYDDGDPLVQIPFGSAVEVLGGTEKDDYRRLWRHVSYESQTGWLQAQNMRENI